MTGTAAGQTITIDGIVLKIPALPGYCVTRDQSLISELQQVVGQMERRIIAISATCEDIAKFDSGQPLDGWRAILWAVRTTERDHAFLLPLQMTRREFADRRAGALQEVNMTEIVGDINKWLESNNWLKNQLSNPRATKFGLIARDPGAVYEVSFIENGGKAVVGITGSTEVHRLQIAISGSDKVTDTATLPALLSLIQQATRALIAENPD